MDFGKAFSFAFQDEDWLKKLAIIGLVFLIPFIGWIVLLGWGMQIAQKIIHREPESLQLPRLEFSNQLSLGFKAFVVQLVYAIPMIILILPIVIISIGIASGSNFLDSKSQIIALIVSICLCGGLVFLYGLLISFMLPMAVSRFLDQGSVGAGLKFDEVFKLVKVAPVPDLLAIVGTSLGSMIGSLGIIACIVGLVVTVPYSLTITGHLYGQAYNEAVAAKAL